MFSSRTSVAIATAVSIVLTGVLFVGTRLIPLESIQMFVFEQTGRWLWYNPFRNLYIFVGFVGGLLAGYLTKPRWQNGCLDGARTGLLTGIGIYLVLVVYNVYSAFMDGGPIAFYVIAIVPLFYVFPIALVFPLEGGLTGALVAWLRST